LPADSLGKRNECGRLAKRKRRKVDSISIAARSRCFINRDISRLDGECRDIRRLRNAHNRHEHLFLVLVQLPTPTKLGRIRRVACVLASPYKIQGDAFSFWTWSSANLRYGISTI
jgi:hypothetical protein